MKARKKYSGVVVPMVTPVLESGKIDTVSVEKIISMILDADCFPFLLGTTGEIAFNSFSNRENLIKTAASFVNGRKTLYAGITDSCMENTIEAGKKYFDLGVNLFVVHLPNFYPLSSDLMLKYYESLAEKLPAPLIIYNIYSVTHMSIPIDVIQKLSTHPKIAGIKDSERDFERAVKLSGLFKDAEDFSLFIGWTNKSSEALLLGYDGIIPNTGNIVPGLFHRLYEAAVKGNRDEANELQKRADSLSDLIQKDKAMSRMIPELKALMASKDICKPYVLPPLEHLSEEDTQILLEKYKILDLQIPETLS
jgi:4-hydroxy-tetrahydrodipicolinate synthase